MKSIVEFLKKILLVIELVIAVAVINWEATLFIGLIFLDQFTKFKIASTMLIGNSITIIDNFFSLTYVHNPGAAFGILPHQRVFFLCVGVLGFALFAYMYRGIEKNDRLLKAGALCLMSGTVGNWIDRFVYGYVIDFLDFKVWTPIFNVADMALVFGVGIVIYDVIKKK